jgi:adenosylcobinamide-GDP ribazoletransferase
MTSFLAALRFLTIFPVGGAIKVDGGLFIRSSKYYPLVGLVIGGMLWGFQRLVQMAFTAELTAGLLIAFWVVLTGALHLDGLGDTLDGCYGGRTPSDRLRIMKDVHLGTMGVVGIVLLLIVKFVVLKELLSSSSLRAFLILIPLGARWTPVFLAAFWPYARSEGGLGLGLVQEMGKKELFWATIFAWGITVGVAGWLGLGFMALLLIWSLSTGWFFFRKLGGVTGDAMGATIETSELLGILFWLGVCGHAQ